MGVFTSKKKLGATVAVGLVCAGLLAGCNKEETKVDPLEGYRTAVVDLQPLLELHPNYGKLEQLNQEIGALEQEKQEIQKESQQDAIAKGGDEMQQAVARAKEKLEAERAAVEGEIAALSSSLSAQLESEMRGLQASYQSELEGEIKRQIPEVKNEPPPPVIDVDNNEKVQDYLANLSLVRERNLAARRLELEKRVGDEIAAKQAEVSSQIAAYESELSAQYQNERLNLQLTAQNSTDEEAKIQAEERLSEISQAIDSAKAAKRAELEGSFAAVRAEKTALVQSELESYQAQLDREVQENLAQKRRELGGQAPPPRPERVPSGNSPDVTAKIREIEGRMQAQLESKKAQLRAQVEAKMAQAREQLEAKSDEVQANLEKLNNDIGLRIEKELANLPEPVKLKIKEVDDKIVALQEESKKLYDSIREDIDLQVGGVAKDKNQEMVIGAYRYKDPSFQDLTDLSQVRVQQMEKKS